MSKRQSEQRQQFIADLSRIYDHDRRAAWHFLESLAVAIDDGEAAGRDDLARMARDAANKLPTLN
jgi:hypothetical protein